MIKKIYSFLSQSKLSSHKKHWNWLTFAFALIKIAALHRELPLHTYQHILNLLAHIGKLVCIRQCGSGSYNCTVDISKYLSVQVCSCLQLIVMNTYN